MKKFYDSFKISILTIFIAAAVFVSLITTQTACTPQTSEVVCDYGSVLCDVSTTICTQIPGVPDQVCTYLNLACYNLDQLCQLRDSTDSPKYEKALSNIQDLTVKLRQWQLSQTNK